MQLIDYNVVYEIGNSWSHVNEVYLIPLIDRSGRNIDQNDDMRLGRFPKGYSEPVIRALINVSLKGIDLKSSEKYLH